MPIATPMIFLTPLASIAFAVCEPNPAVVNSHCVAGSTWTFGGPIMSTTSETSTCTVRENVYYTGDWRNFLLMDNAVKIMQRNVAGNPVNLLTHFFDDNVYLDSPSGPMNFRTGVGLLNVISINTLGGMQIKKAGNGITLKSPNGLVCAEISLSNLGVLITTSVACQ